MSLDSVTVWSLVAGVVFLLAAFGNGFLQKIPISISALYLLAGLAIGPWGLSLLELNFSKDHKLIETLSEIAILISLMTAGLRLSPSMSHLLSAPVPLALIAMTVTIGGITGVGVFGLGLPLGAAVLLGAVLAPTDPVLASEVQVEHEEDTDRLRYSLTGEAGLNDGTAFPFVMLGLGILGLHQVGDNGLQWVAVDLIWATSAGVFCGALTGFLTSKAAVWAKNHSDSPTQCEELLTLGLIGISYGIALAINSYGFLSVFAAGVAMRRFAEKEDEGEEAERMMKTVMGINQRFGEILEVALVVMTGVLLSSHWALGVYWWFALLLFFVIRPIATLLALARSKADKTQHSLIAFFGIRGIGSLYYLSFSIGEGLDKQLASQLAEIVLATIALSLLIHSNAASLILSHYGRTRSKS